MNFEIANFTEGTFFYYQHDSLLYVFQVLKHKEESSCVQEYWSTSILPDFEQLNHLDIKTCCTLFESTDCELHWLGFKQITAKQENEIVNFQRIKLGKETRELEFKRLKQAAFEAFNKANYEEAIRLISEAAPYSKYAFDLYKKRGECYLMLKQYQAALSDFDFYLTHQPNDVEVEAFVLKIKQEKT